MREDLIHYLGSILVVEEKLRPHSGFPNLKKAVNEALLGLEQEIGEAAPVIFKSIPVEAPELPMVYPDGTGITETNTGARRI